MGTGAVIAGVKAMREPKVVVPRPAATIVLVRDAPAGGGVEALLFQRSPKAKFMPGAFVFPGGAVDADDMAPEILAHVSGLDHAQANARLGVAEGGLAYFVAAIRECFEECGIVLSSDEGGEFVGLHDTEHEARLAEQRIALNRGELAFSAFVQRERLRLAADKLTYFAHWITPVGMARRFDTRFFLTVVPPRQTPQHDANELVSQVWLRPEEAVEQADAGKLDLRTPTRSTLHNFSGARSAGELVERMRNLREIRAILPVINAEGVRLMPGDPGFEAQGRIDPADGGAR
jgi:8-oxo-dGTP pyrophosphatase MutT (NUDIX family)